MLKYTASAIAPSLTKLLTSQLLLVVFLRTGNVLELSQFFKSSDPSLPKNYRPISILPIVSKLLEQHVHSLIFKHLL